MLNMKTAALAAAMMLSYQNSQAADVKLNSMCYLEPGSSSETQAFNPTPAEIKDAASPYIKKFYTKVTKDSLEKQFRIASLSKAFTTHWAITELGPEYRFTTKVIFTPGIKSDSCHIHFQGDLDPVLGRKVLSNVIDQLNNRKAKADINCNTVETVTFDENFRFFPEALDHQNNPQDRMSWAWSNPAPYQRPSRTKTLLIKYLTPLKGFKPTDKNVGMSLRKEFGDYAKELTRKVFTFKSMPMFRILKEMNRYSHNYIANMIFDRLGGANRYAAFMQNRLSLDTSAVHLLNGSGYPVDGDYNLANCGAITYMLRDLDNVITNTSYSKKYQMADLFPVGGMSEPYSTFKSFYSGGTFDKTMVAKTGSAQQAITFAGALSTKDGNLYFAALTSPVSYGNPFLNQSRFLIKDLMQIMAERENLKPMDYSVPGLLPAFDAGIVLKELQVAAAPPITSPAIPAVIPTPEAPAAPAAIPLDEDDETPKPGSLLLIKKG